MFLLLSTFTFQVIIKPLFPGFDRSSMLFISEQFFFLLILLFHALKLPLFILIIPLHSYLLYFLLDILFPQHILNIRFLWLTYGSLFFQLSHCILSWFLFVFSLLLLDLKPCLPQALILIFFFVLFIFLIPSIVLIINMFLLI